ncbi:MAG: hypothetical protein ACTSRA_12685 [Promethearchaeota archaeon]
MPLVLGVIGLITLYGAVYFIRIFKKQFLRKKVRKDKRWKKVPLILISIVLFFGGSFLMFEKIIAHESLKHQYLEVQALLNDPGFLNAEDRMSRRNSIIGIMADYDLEPRLSGDVNSSAGPGADARVDIDALINNCEVLGVNCYHFLIWHRDTDWLDFQDFVTAAESSQVLMNRNFSVWIYLVPPSESKIRESEPFGQDYIEWMRQVSKFSANHSIVTAVCIDDFFCSIENQELFTPEYLQAMRDAADQYNPSLALVSCLYWESVNPSNIDNVWRQAIAIAPYIDGILYPYLAASTGGYNHVNTDALQYEISQVRKIYPNIPVILDIYASKHSACDEYPDPVYVSSLLDGARNCCDGVALYCGPKINLDGSIASFLGGMSNPREMFDEIKVRFDQWTEDGW